MTTGGVGWCGWRLQIGVFVCEVGVDWIKHCFVNKFNRLHEDVYPQFNYILCFDYVNSRRKIDVRSCERLRMSTGHIPHVPVIRRIALCTDISSFVLTSCARACVRVCACVPVCVPGGCGARGDLCVVWFPTRPCPDGP